MIDDNPGLTNFFTIKSKLKEWRSPQELIMKVITVVEVWREWAVFPDDFFLCLETLLIGQSAHTSDLHNQLTLRSLLVKSEVVDLEDYAAELRKHPYNELKSIKSCHGVPNALSREETLVLLQDIQWKKRIRDIDILLSKSSEGSLSIKELESIRELLEAKDFPEGAITRLSRDKDFFKRLYSVVALGNALVSSYRETELDSTLDGVPLSDEDYRVLGIPRTELYDPNDGHYIYDDLDGESLDDEEEMGIEEHSQSICHAIDQSTTTKSILKKGSKDIKPWHLYSFTQRNLMKQLRRAEIACENSYKKIEEVEKSEKKSKRKSSSSASSGSRSRSHSASSSSASSSRSSGSDKKRSRKKLEKKSKRREQSPDRRKTKRKSSYHSSSRSRSRHRENDSYCRKY